MFRHVLTGALLLCAAHSQVAAQALSCNAVLNSNLINTKSTSTSEVMISRMQTDICNKTFSSKGNVQEYMRSGGWGLEVFDLFDNSLTDSKSQSSGSYTIENTEFCDKSSADLAKSFGADYLEKNGQFVLRAFEHCVDATNADLLYLSYELHDYGADQIMSGELVRNTGPWPTSLVYDIEGFSVTPKGSKVSCEILGQTIPEDVSKSNPISVTSSPASIACSKSEDRTVSVTIQTSEGAFQIVSPSNKEDERLADTRILASQLNNAQSRNTELNTEIAALESTLATTQSQLQTAKKERNTYAKRHNAHWFSIYTGDGGWQGRRDIFAPCGTPINRDFGVGQCAAHNMTFWALKFAGDHGGGHCGHSWFMLLCQAK